MPDVWNVQHMKAIVGAVFVGAVGRQWRYSPVMLNGRPSGFVLTVVVSFHLDEQATAREAE